MAVEAYKTSYLIEAYTNDNLKVVEEFKSVNLIAALRGRELLSYKDFEVFLKEYGGGEVLMLSVENRKVTYGMALWNAINEVSMPAEEFVKTTTTKKNHIGDAQVSPKFTLKKEAL